MLPHRLHKAEIVANFLQIYGLVLVLPDIPWPKVWLDFSIFTNFFTFDWERYFSIDVPFAMEMKFGGVMLIPAVAVFTYALLDRVTAATKEAWEESYIRNWTSVKWRAFGFWLLALVLSFGIGLASDASTSVDRMKNGSGPSGTTNGVLAVLAVCSTCKCL